MYILKSDLPLDSDVALLGCESWCYPHTEGRRRIYGLESDMKAYLCKFIPPRADFLTTMTADEAKWMKQHAAFLDDLLAKGVVVAHCPVMDPNGGYGVSLYQIADDESIEAITSQDPIVKNGAGHYEHHPMRHLAARG